MSRSETARGRWAALTLEERRARTAAGRAAELERRQLASRVLNALIAAGLRVEAASELEGDHP